MASRPSPPSPEPASPKQPAAPKHFSAKAGEARRRVERVFHTLAKKVEGLDLPAVAKISQRQKRDPFHILISTLLSARTQDATTLAASTRLFARAPTPQAVAKLTTTQIEKLIYPVGFYRNKAVFVKDAAKAIVARFGGKVPKTMEALVTLPGVGRKTANLVLIIAFKSDENICVDVHVHRISNRLGWVNTRTPEETEQALYTVVEQRWWRVVNQYLVAWGQNVCRPVRPRCNECSIVTSCRRVGVS